MAELTRFAQEWLPLFLLHMLEASAFAGLVFLAEKSMRPPVHLSYAMWLLVLAKFFIPPVIVVPLAIAPDYIPSLLLSPVLTEGASTTARSTFSPALAALLLWLIATTVIAALIATQNLQLRRRLSTAKPIHLEAPHHRDISIPGDLRLWVCRAIKTPLLKGLFRHHLYLPPAHKRWSRSQMEGVLAHEYAHIRHSDHWVLALQLVALSLFGLNPLVWLMHRRLLGLRELRCDEFAIRQSGMSPLAYSRMLLGLLESQARPAITGTYFAGSHDNLRQRFQHMLAPASQHSRRQRLVQRCIACGLALCIVPLSLRCSHLPLAPQPLAQAPIPSFVPYDSPPQPIGGFPALQQAVRYPETAHAARREGRVVLNVSVYAGGQLGAVTIVSSFGDPACEQAAIDAVRSVQWQPAMRNNRPVPATVGIPIIFRLPGRDAAAEPVPERLQPLPGEQLIISFAPMPVGGMEAIKNNLVIPGGKQPAPAKKQVVVNTLIDVDGQVIGTRVLQSTGSPAYDEAAVDAIQRTAWQPARQGEQPMRIWVAIPIVFGEE